MHGDCNYIWMQKTLFSLKNVTEMALNKKKFDIVYKNFAKPVAGMKEVYERSALTVEAGVVNKKVAECFNNLMKALNEQLDSYRK